MKKIILFLSLGTLALLLSCEKEVVNIGNEPDVTPDPTTPLDTKVNPVNINDKGFNFLELMQGQWVGKNRVIADDYDWFAWDYRAISPSQTHGIFEGGSMGNLFTDFFVTDFKNTRTIMARNGGVLNGIYRTSYFVMDSVRTDSEGEFFRFVNAIGGANTMFLELRFVADSLYYNAYTSRLGENAPASRHMTFKGKKRDNTLAESIATIVGYPQNTPAFDFSNEFNPDHLATDKSASFLAQSDTKNVFELAVESGDPYTINDQPLLGYIDLTLEKHPQIQGADAYIFLSTDPLTNEWGEIQYDNFNSVMLFSQLIPEQNEFLYTYIHPGDYFITVIMDVNGDGGPSPGDYTHVKTPIQVTDQGQHSITIKDINIQN